MLRDVLEMLFVVYGPVELVALGITIALIMGVVFTSFAYRRITDRLQARNHSIKSALDDLSTASTLVKQAASEMSALLEERAEQFASLAEAEAITRQRIAQLEKLNADLNQKRLSSDVVTQFVNDTTQALDARDKAQKARQIILFFLTHFISFVLGVMGSILASYIWKGLGY